MPSTTPSSLRASGNGWSITPNAIKALFTTPRLCSSVIQAKPRTSTDSQNYNSTMNSIQSRVAGRACIMA